MVKIEGYLSDKFESGSCLPCCVAHELMLRPSGNAGQWLPSWLLTGIYEQKVTYHYPWTMITILSNGECIPNIVDIALDTVLQTGCDRGCYIKRLETLILVDSPARSSASRLLGFWFSILGSSLLVWVIRKICVRHFIEGRLWSLRITIQMGVWVLLEARHLATTHTTIINTSGHISGNWNHVLW